MIYTIGMIVGFILSVVTAIMVLTAVAIVILIHDFINGMILKVGDSV